MGAPGLLEILLIFIVVTITWILPVLAFWKICSKAGFPSALSLLMIVPVANIILPLFVAFADWPVLKKLEQRETEE